jgi:choline dehydrogenase-like flavoprotein
MNPRGRGEIAYVDGVGGTRGAVGPGPGLRVTLSDDPHDAAALVEGARLVADRLGIAAPVGPVPSTSQHLTGSAAIGEVVDDSGRVLGVAGLRVADASVFPSIPGCGPYYSVLAVAEDLASRMIEQGAW